MFVLSLKLGGNKFVCQNSHLVMQSGKKPDSKAYH